MNKPILCLDFDGVCHSYTSGWKGAGVIPDRPVDGMWEFLSEAVNVFEVAIFSSRSNQDGGIAGMKDWFYLWAEGDWPQIVDKLSFPTEKPPAFVGIDDRVITFKGSWPDVEELRGFKTWMQNPLGATNVFPRGKVSAEDEGELRLAVFHKDGTVFVDFGKQTVWIGLDASAAHQLADLIHAHARECT
jgi:hypothetical protein